MGDSPLVLCAIQILRTKSAGSLLCTNTMLTSRLSFLELAGQSDEDSPSSYSSPLQAFPACCGRSQRAKTTEVKLKIHVFWKSGFGELPYSVECFCGIVYFPEYHFPRENHPAVSYFMLFSFELSIQSDNIVTFSWMVYDVKLQFYFFINWQATCTFIPKCFVFENIEISIWWNNSDT